MHQPSKLLESSECAWRVGVQILPTPWSERVLLLHFHLLTGSCWDVVVDSLVMVIHSYCQDFLGIGLANNILIEVGIDLYESEINEGGKMSILINNTSVTIYLKLRVIIIIIIM